MNCIVSVLIVAFIAHVQVYCIWLRSLCWTIVFSSRVFAPNNARCWRNTIPSWYWF